MELNTLDLGRVRLGFSGAGLVPVLTVPGEVGKDYGRWVKITLPLSNRRKGCQEEGRAEAWRIYGSLSSLIRLHKNIERKTNTM